MSLIQVTDLTFAYPGSFDNVFEHATFQLDTDWKLGFVGRNGRGKTTFLRLLMGRLPCGGAIRASVPFDYFPFGVPDPSASPAELLGAFCPEAQPWQLARELGLLGMDPGRLYQPFCTLSQGQQTKVLLGLLFLRQGHFLLIDEPTNHLDLEARQAVSRYLAGKRGFILVSHDRAFLDGCVDHVLAINKKSIQVQRGNYTTWQQNWQLRQQFEQRQNDRLQKQIGQLTAAARRTSAWSDKVEAGKTGIDPVKRGAPRPDRGHIGHQAAKMMQRAKAIEGRRQAAVDEKRGLLQEVEETGRLKLTPLAHPKQVLVRAAHLNAFYGQLQALHDLGFVLEQGQRLAVQGPNGCGKSTLFGLILGQSTARAEGLLEVAAGLTISWLPQATGQLAGPLGRFEAQQGLDPTLFRAVLRKLGFERAQFEKDMASYSEGQKKKAALAASLCRPAHLYVWDEPLNYIDLPARGQVEELLLAFRPTLLFVEHDAVFTEKVATHVLRL